MLHRFLIALGCVSVLLTVIGCARPATGAEMNASETSQPAQVTSVPVEVSPAATLAIGPAPTSQPLRDFKTPTPAATASAGGTITLQNAEGGVTLRVGERVLLNLGERWWQVRVGDPTIVRLVQEPNAPPGALGYLEGLKPGKTQLSATSDPPCRSAKPPCLMPTLFVEIPVTVME